MDAVLATIVAGGQTLIQSNIRLIKYIDFYINSLILQKPFDSSLGTNMRKAASHLYGMDLLNPRR
jgi:hypothetical protein